MFDMNFFSVYKKNRAKSKGLKIFLAVFIIVLLLVNAAIIGGGLWLFSSIEQDIQEKEDWINDPATQDSIQQAEQIKKEADLTTSYLALLQTVDQKMDQIDFIESDLLNHIRTLTPPNTVFSSAQISGIYVTLNCESTEPTGPMDMYHAFRNSEQLTNVVLSGISIGEAVSSFTITCQILIEGGDAS